MKRKERVSKKSLPPMKKKGNKQRKSTGKQIKNPTNHNLTTTVARTRERESERERGKYERDDAEICLDFCLFSFRAPAAVPRVSACSFELTTERKKERKKFCADLLIYDETSAFKLLVEG